ncbi:cytochrome P460 family protein [Lysobacter enzymogenes]|uniref:cytochrome P460 family protein n=1 Tax=Lysobacter enzymogenes TaxID=69 RepID=UPI003850C67C
MRADRGESGSPRSGAHVHRFELGDACLAAALALSLSVACLAQAGAAPAAPPAAAGAAANPAAIAFPTGYTRWTHIKSGLITSAHAAFPRFGGLHHVYANPAALQGLRGGAYPDGAVLVYDLFETRDNAGIVGQGPRRHIDVMVRDSARFQASGGWGYAEFAAGERSDRLKDAERDGCAACHATRHAHGDVFSEWGNAGEADASS